MPYMQTSSKHCESIKRLSVSSPTEERVRLVAFKQHASFNVSVLGLSMSSVLVNMSYPQPFRSCPPISSTLTVTCTTKHLCALWCSSWGRQLSLVSHQYSDRPEHKFTENRHCSRPVEGGKNVTSDCSTQNWKSVGELDRNHLLDSRLQPCWYDNLSRVSLSCCNSWASYNLASTWVNITFWVILPK